jgi:hypothetical protein
VPARRIKWIRGVSAGRGNLSPRSDSVKWPSRRRHRHRQHHLHDGRRQLGRGRESRNRRGAVRKAAMSRRGGRRRRRRQRHNATRHGEGGLASIRADQSGHENWPLAAAGARASGLRTGGSRRRPVLRPRRLCRRHKTIQNASRPAAAASSAFSLGRRAGANQSIPAAVGSFECCAPLPLRFVCANLCPAKGSRGGGRACTLAGQAKWPAPSWNTTRAVPSACRPPAAGASSGWCAPPLGRAPTSDRSWQGRRTRPAALG